MISVASLSTTPSSHTSKAHRSSGKNLARMGQSLLSSVTGGLGMTGVVKGLSTGGKAIQNAVTAALQDVNQSTSKADTDQLIKNAIKQVFKSGLSSPSQAVSDGLADESSDAGSSTGAASSTAGKTFQEVLQSFGVSLSQFKQDLASAVQETVGGASDPTSPSQTISPGSLLNVIA